MPNIISATKKKIKSYLKEIHGKQYKDVVNEINGDFVINRGSAAVHVFVKPLHKNDCIITACAYVVQGAKITPKLLTYLMRFNARSPMGAFGLLTDDTITYTHSIAGAHVDKNELRTTIGTVAFVADEEDDNIRKMAGGLRAVDAKATLLGDMTLATPIAAAPKKPVKKAAPKQAPKPKAQAKKKTK